MADTSQQQPLSEPHTNGVMDGLTEEEKSKMRPADIDADMREMERRKRVEMMMNSRLFREELERIIETQMKDGAGPSGLLQQISDMMGAQGARFNANVFKTSNCVLPINDIRGVESMGYAKGEKLLRCKLAAVFRLLDLYGWTQGVGGQITARLNQDQEHFLVNPYGLLYHEVTASSLIKVDMQGTVVEQGTTNFGVHVAGFQLHSTIHAARPDIKCIVHITTPSVTAISSLKCGLLPIGQESIVIGEVSTHQYVGGFFEPEEKEKIARNLGPMNKVMLLTNRGALCCGETVEEAFFNVYNMVLACETQLKLMPAGLDNLNLISEESKKAIFEASRKPPTPQQTAQITETTALAEKLEKRWRIGGTEFEALMRMLDNAGFRTGYIYRNPLVKGEPPRPRNDVEVPPAVSSLGYLLEEEELYKQGLWKGGRKGTDRSRWLNSPNVYQKVEILETGTPDPKKITKWVSDGSPTHSSTPVKIDSALQFVPKNTNPKEFKQLQQQIKDYRRADKISAGPQSHILEGVTWEEAKKMQDATISGTGEQVVLVGAASKGIIQRGFQHNAMVYKTPYAKNPFDAVTDQELDQYKREVERKQKGDIYDESQSESEALSSFNVSRATHESSTAKSPIQSPVSVTSETEEESRDEPRVLRIETKQVPAPSQPEVVLSDDLGSPSRFCSQCKNKCENKIENDACIISEHRHCPVAELYQYEPRLEIVRGDIIAERLVTKLIDYRPCPPVILTGEQLNCSGDTKYNGLEQVPNSVYFEDKKTQELTKKRKSKVRRSLEMKNNVNSLNVPSSNEKMKEKDGNDKTNLKSIDTSSMEQITEIVSCIDSNIPPTKTKLIALSSPELKVSKKYSLDPSDMSLIYSLTPCMNSENDHENIDKTMIDKSSKLSTFEPNNNLEQNCFLQSNEERSPKNEQQRWEKKDCVDDKIDNYIWFNSLSDSGKCELSNDNKTINNDICFDNGQIEIHSNEGSDMLELFADTTSELLETTGEYFRNDISNMANEIIAELNGNDTYVIIYCLVNEIFQKVYDTLSSIELNDRYSSPLSIISRQFSTPKLCLNVKDNEHTPKEIKKTQTNQTTPVIVIHEVIHHVIDACDEIKKAKTCANIELREKGNNDTVSNEEENIGQQKDLTTMINSDKSKKASDRNTHVAPTVTAFENLLLYEKNDQSTETAAEADDTKETAIFEFHTLVKTKPTSTDKKEFELNFRIERNFDVESSVENKTSHRQSKEEVEPGLSESLEKLAEIDFNINSDVGNKRSHKQDKEKVKLSRSECLEKLVELGWNIDLNNLLEIDTREEELAKLSETPRAVELKEKEDSNTSNNEKEEIGQQVDNLTTMINSDESEKGSDRSMEVTSISFENLALDEENNQSVKTEADAIFEFRTRVKAKPINTDKEAVELNFQIERSFDVESSVENKTSHRQSKEEIEPGLSESLEKLAEIDFNINSDVGNKRSHKQDKEKVKLSRSECLEKLVELGWNIDLNNLLEIDTREEELAKLSETPRAVELKEKEDSNTSNNEKEENGQQVDNLTTMINSDESEKGSDRSMEVTSISFENLALDEENNQSVKTEADAIFEFHTRVKVKPINTDKEAVELNFRIERSFDVESSVENKTSHRQSKEEVETGLSESLGKLVEMDYNVGSYDLFEIEKRRREPMTLSETTKAVEACDDCIYCMNSCPMDYNQEYSPLSTIGEEESDEKIVDLKAEIGGKRLNDTYTFCDSDEIVNDK